SEVVERIRVINLGDTKGVITLDHTVQYTTKLAGVTTETVRCLYRTLTTGEDLVDGTHDTFRQQRLSLRKSDLFRISAGINENFNNAVILSLQCRYRLGQGVCHFVQIQYGILTTQNHVYAASHFVPLGGQLGHHCGIFFVGVLDLYPGLPVDASL